MNRNQHWGRTVPRLNRRQRTVLIVICVAVTVLCSVTAITDAVSAAMATVPAVVTSRAIVRGDQLTSSSVTLADVPAHTALEGSLSSVEEAEGSVALIDIPSGGLVTAAMLTDAPVIPAGFTEIAVPLASSSVGVVPGSTVTLSGFCTSLTEDSSSSVCIVAETALVLAVEDENDPSATAGTILHLALPPEEALNVLAVQEVTPIVAVTILDDS